MAGRAGEPITEEAEDVHGRGEVSVEQEFPLFAMSIEPKPAGNLPLGSVTPSSNWLCRPIAFQLTIM